MQFPPSWNSAESKHECGLFGVWAPGEDVARLTFFGLFALQHRGQESAGIAAADGERVIHHKGMGLVSQVFDENALARLPGDLACGHVRYSTTGSSWLANAQPVVVNCSGFTLALGHNGNLVNALSLRERLREAGIGMEGSTDSEIIARLIALESAQGDGPEAAIGRAAAQLQGAFSLVMMTEKSLFGLRDRNGVRPLCLGRLNGGHYVLASENCALNVVGARFVREVEPGEMVVVDSGGLRSQQVLSPGRHAMCIFEFIYIARPDSHIYGKSLHEARRRMGQQLAAEHPARADLVIPVPDTGWPAAIGYAEASRIPFGEGLIKNRYIHRTFIQPDQRLRDLGVKMKLTPLRETLAGKRVVVVEDSIVRGTTTRNIIRMIKDAGAVEVHVRISSPPYRFPCFYGVDTFDRRHLLAARLRSVEEIRQFIGADSLGYLSIQGMIKGVGVARSKFCQACFSNDYPIAIPEDIRVHKFTLEEEEDREAGDGKRQTKATGIRQPAKGDRQAATGDRQPGGLRQ